jgi:hypothetical protein
MKSEIYSVVTSFSSLEIHRRFGVTYHFLLQGRRICKEEAGNKHASMQYILSFKQLPVFRLVTDYIRPNLTKTSLVWKIL